MFLCTRSFPHSQHGASLAVVHRLPARCAEIGIGRVEKGLWGKGCEWRDRVAGASLALLLVGGGSSCTTVESLAPEERFGSRSETAQPIAPFDLQLSRSRYCRADALHPIAAGRVRLGVEVELTAHIDQVPANPYYARLVSSDGRVTDARLGGCGPRPSPELLSRAESARGWITFDVPENHGPLRLSYEPVLVGHPPSEKLEPVSHTRLPERR